MSVEQMAWMRRMHEASERLTAHERMQLEAFGQEHLGDGWAATSDWPGGEPIIGKPPWEARPGNADGEAGQRPSGGGG